MNKIKFKQASVKVNNKTVVIYYSLQGEEMRFPTGVVLHSVKDGLIYVYWDKKTNRLAIPPYANTDQISEIKTKQDTIDSLLNKANHIILEHYKRDIIIKPNELKALLSTQQETRYVRANTSFFEYLEEFLAFKKKHFQARGNPISIKDYNSTYLLLQDFQAYNNKSIMVHDVTTHWLELFVQYMSIKHDPYHGDHKVSSKGEMADSTIKKRLDILGEFYGYLNELKVVKIDEVNVIKSFKKTIRKEPTHKETLSIPEIHQLYKFKFDKEHLGVIRDIFVFFCLTGIRYQDLNQFDKRFIRKSEDGKGLIYKKKASKTGIDYNIPLSKIVIEILERYNYKFPMITDQYGNRAIKEALKETGMFNEITQMIDKETGEYKHRYDAITLHKGRNSFITNLVDTTPLNELMKYTGHKKLSTLQGYIDTNRAVKMDYIKIFDMA